MIDINNLERVVCRPALAKDTEGVLELCSHIWDGGDYIPRVWEDWLTDPDGLLGVAELGGRVVGIFKLTKFQEGEWYLEGLRVHPEFQGQGIASHIHAYVIETWRRMGSGLVRLVTHSENVKVHRMCEESGFKRILEFIPYRAPILPEETDNFTLVKMDEAPQALEFVLHSQTHALSGGLINLGWVYGDLQLKHLVEVVGDKHAWRWRDRTGFISIWEDDEDDVPQPGIELIACQMSDLPELLLDYRRWMNKIGYTSPGWIAPNQPELLPVLEKAGFTRSWDKSLYIYELRSSDR
jgi:ribosomal protein S18 acetylase RimI-like enzyme